MSEITDIDLIQHYDKDFFFSCLNRAIKDGWIPIGAIQVTHVGEDGDEYPRFLYSQTVHEVRK